MRVLALFAIVLTSTVPLSCVNVADDRADDDERVGRATSPALDVTVEGGLACVRDLASGRLTLRAQAPILRIAVTVNDGAPELQFELDNALPDATLEVRAAGGAPVPVRPLPGPRPTSKRWGIATTSKNLTLRVGAPDEAVLAPWRFAVMADVQEAIARVGEIYAVVNRNPSIRFLLFTGDLTQRGTAEQLARFEKEEEALAVPLYATLGNHELGADEVYFQRTFGRGNFHFDFRGVAFTLVDSASATISPKVYGWLDDWLAPARDRVHVVAMHIPPLDPSGTRNGAFANRGEAGKLLAKLADGKVDLTVYGHIHSYYAYANAGIPAYISGGGGAIPERLDGIGRNFLTVDVDPAVNRVMAVSLVRIEPD